MEFCKCYYQAQSQSLRFLDRDSFNFIFNSLTHPPPFPPSPPPYKRAVQTDFGVGGEGCGMIPPSHHIVQPCHTLILNPWETTVKAFSWHI